VQAGEFTAESSLPCPECRLNIHVGTAGTKNLDIHQNSKACVAERNQQNACAWPRPKLKPNQTLHTFFGAKMAPNPPQVYVPAPVHAPEAFSVVLVSRNGDAIPVPLLSGKSFTLDNETLACPIAMDLLSKLCEGMEQIPTTNLTAAEGHLHEFGADPLKCIHPKLEDWEDLLNPMMK
jgi:hypothetical protein